MPVKSKLVGSKRPHKDVKKQLNGNRKDSKVAKKPVSRKSSAHLMDSATTKNGGSTSLSTSTSQGLTNGGTSKNTHAKSKKKGTAAVQAVVD